MGFDGSGNYTRTNGTQTGTTLWQDRAAISPATISASEHDAEMNDVATALTACLKADGSKVATNNLPMGGFKHTGVADATLSNQYTTLGQVQTGFSVNDFVVSANNTTTALRVTQTGTGDAFRVEDSANPDSSPFVIKNDGAVAIGSTDPGSAKLYVEGEIAGDTFTAINTITATNAIKSALEVIAPTVIGGTFSTLANPSAETGVIRGVDANGSSSNVNGGTLKILGGKATGNAVGGPIIFETSAVGASGSTIQTSTERARITNTGRLGVGATSPQTKLHVTGTTSSTSSGATNKGTIQLDESGITALTQDGGIEFKASAANSGYGARIVCYDDANLVIARRSNAATWTESARIDPLGRVGLGKTPAYQLDLSTDGAAKLTTNTWTTTSDVRIKTNITNYTKGLSELKQLRPVEFEYNGKAGTPVGTKAISVLAHEIEPIFPECVGRFWAKLEPTDDNETELLNYNGHAITFALINAVQELASRVEALEAQVATLKGA